MAKFLCVCGTPISTSGAIPNPHEWHLLSDVEFDTLLESVDAEDPYIQTRTFYRCPVSGHLWVFWNGFDASPKVYEPLDIDMALNSD